MDAQDESGAQEAFELLRHGRVEVTGTLAQASNTTLLVRLCLGEVSAAAVYKPVSGERPLWDFPRSTLGRREVAAHLLSQAGGWGVVPPTVLRDGPFGPGSMQLWVDPDPASAVAGDPGAGLVDVVAVDQVPTGWLPVLTATGTHGEPVALVHADDEDLASMAVFDVVTNNADRKGGHVLLGAGGRVFGVDHGLTLHDEPKLRTVLWGWAGRPLGEVDVGRLERLAEQLDGHLAAALAALVSTAEVVALRARVERLRRGGRFPAPRRHGPAIPWPPF